MFVPHVNLDQPEILNGHNSVGSSWRVNRANEPFEFERTCEKSDFNWKFKLTVRGIISHKDSVGSQVDSHLFDFHDRVDTVVLN